VVRRALGKAGLWLFGWQLVGEIPAPRRSVVIGYPHTSNFDFPMMLLLSFALDVSFHWVGKMELFEGPFGWVYRALNGIPITRESRTDTVTQLAERFEEGGDLLLAIAPSGTRKAGTHWRSGFYHIAVAAKVPIMVGFIDFGRRRGGIAGTISPSGDIVADMDLIRALLSQVKGYRPQTQIPIRLREELEE